jgi:hypothetical protein
MKPVFLVIGVPGSGKTWVCEQLTEKFDYVPHDPGWETHLLRLLKAARKGDKPVISEVPFGERDLIASLRSKGVKVKPIFVVEKPEVAASRYQRREGKPIGKGHLKRAATMAQRAARWGAFSGTSTEVLRHLKGEISGTAELMADAVPIQKHTDIRA